MGYKKKTWYKRGRGRQHEVKSPMQKDFARYMKARLGTWREIARMLETEGKNKAS
jgi:hypothetical protein